jgi:hypothetical protein
VPAQYGRCESIGPPTPGVLKLDGETLGRSSRRAAGLYWGCLPRTEGVNPCGKQEYNFFILASAAPARSQKFEIPGAQGIGTT